jgi:hypothetical protein
MYVARTAASKTPAGIRVPKLRRIIRRIRLADLQRTCRLPIGAWQVDGGGDSLFPAAPTKCLAWGKFRRAAASLGGRPALFAHAGKIPGNLQYALHIAGKAFRLCGSLAIH